MKNEWDEHAADWDTNREVVLYAENAFASLCHLVTLDGLRILDFGCGTGLLTEKMAPHATRIVALDTSPEMLSILRAKNLANVDVVEEELSANLAATQGAFTAKFDLIVASSVCGFLPNYARILGVLTSLLNKGGSFVQWDWLAQDGNSDSGLTRNEVLGAFKGVGLDLSSISTPFAMANDDGELSVLMAVGNRN